MRDSRWSLAKLLQIYRLTWRYLGKASAIERRMGHLPDILLNSMMQAWSQDVLGEVGATVDQFGYPTRERVLFVGNHISYLDIPLLMSRVPVAFVAKAEIGSWPLFGRCCKRLGTILVRRKSKQSRINAGLQIKQALEKQQRSIAIFPSGTTQLYEQKPWRLGAFRIAAEQGIKVQPFAIRYEPARHCAYINRDFFPWHLLKLLTRQHIHATIIFDKPRYITDPEKDCQDIQVWVRRQFSSVEAEAPPKTHLEFSVS